MAKPIQSWIADNIDARLEALNLSARDASLRTGKGADLIRNIKRASMSRRPYSPRTDTLQLLAEVLQTTPEALMAAEPLPPKTPGIFRPEPELLGEVDLKVFAAAEGGPGAMVVSTEVVDLVPRPWFFKHVPDAYAVIVTGSSMEPVYEPGDMVLVNPRLPCIRGKDAIFVGGEEHGEFRASIKRYVGSTETHWIARQFNPPDGQKDELRLPRVEWNRALRVVGKYTG